MSSSKTKYWKYKISDETHIADAEMRTDTEVIPSKGSFKYLGSIIKRNEETDNDVIHRIKVR